MERAMTLIRELIDIPEEVRRDAFVLKLSDGLQKAEQTLRQYVVTPQLEKAFGEALSFIESAVEGRTSRATYLHGSFGSGKSHFMAVLHLLMNGHPAARSIGSLQTVLGSHDRLLGRKFLMVPYHLIGADSLEQAVFDGYVQHVRALHPDAPPPAVYRTEDLFRNARGLLDQLGEAAFFAKLNSADSGGPGGAGDGDDLDWGELSTGWTRAEFDAAIAAAPNDLNRRRLLQDLVATHFPAFQGYASGESEALVNLDDGLAYMSQHAKSLGYDALVLFLDEVMLWLAARARDKADMNQEAQKLAKLVEAQNPNRPAPIVAFLARQRPLSELVGEEVDGAERARLDASFKWNDGRFDEIRLEDRNLPLIARERLLRPKDDGARATLEGAFERFAKGPQRLIDQLLTSGSDLASFKAVYPFSPALVQALVALSGALQRERTALRVMAMLLVESRDRLRVGELIPVGDLWDVISKNAEPFSAEMKDRFEAARRLYREKLHPLLVHASGADPDAPGDLNDPKARAALNDGRLVKTLLMGALVPQVEALRGLDAHKLAALNHGTIRSPIPGQEAAAVLAKVRRWAGAVGEIRIDGDASNPTIHIELSNVDVDGLIEKVGHVGTPGNKKRRIAELVFAVFGRAAQQETTYQHDFVWNGTRRRAEILFANVRELRDESLTMTGADWRVIVDYPFDEGAFGPAEDVQRAEQYLEDHPNGSRVLLWLPRFFSAALARDLGTLVCIEHLLTGDTFDRNAGHLSPEQRVDARAQLGNRKAALTARLENALAAAYGLQTGEQGMLDEAHEDHARYFMSLMPGFEPRPPGTGQLAAGLEMLLRQALAFQFPGHPTISITGRDGEREVTAAMARKVWGWCETAASDPNRRALVEKKDRAEVKAVVEALGIGTLDDGPLVVGTRWRDTIDRWSGSEGVGQPTVGEIRDWLDAGEPMGLPPVLSDLIVLTYAVLTNRKFTIHGGPVGKTPGPGELRNDYRLETLDLPDEATWAKARARAEALFGVASSRLRNGANVSALAGAVREKLAAVRGSAAAALDLLADRGVLIGGVGASWARRDVATRLAGLPNPDGLDAKALVEAVAGIPESSDDGALVNNMGRLAAQNTALDRRAEWALFGRLPGVGGARAADAAAALDTLRTALAQTEFAQPLGPVVDRMYPVALDLLTETPPPPPPLSDWVEVGSGEEQGGRIDWDGLRAEAERVLDGPGRRRVTVKWVVEEYKPR